MKDLIADLNPDALFMDGFDDALVGYAQQFTNPPLPIYDYDRLVAACVEQGMTEEEAVEYLSFNVEGAWVGPNTPLILHRLTEDEGIYGPPVEDAIPMHDLGQN